jgi:Metal-dependent hydrolases of the beta-lactamase superfamily II
MKVQVLIDNIEGYCCSRKLFGEWGLSVYVEFEGKRYLLDTGASHLFAKTPVSWEWTSRRWISAS